jgi:LysR family glycine cleavage system transcriptional activator
MTQAAVSYQIKVLEERIGAPLFVRKARGVDLTKTGQQFAKRTSEALDILGDAFSDAKTYSQETLSISVIPTFGTNFLAQRLGAFQMENPKIAVRVEISEALVDLQAGSFDIAIRGGKGAWEGLISHLLMPTYFTPMMSPKLAQSIGGVDSPTDLLDLPFISGGDPWWKLWLEAAGITDVDILERRSQQFGPQILEANAAIAGQGVAMLSPAFFQNELANGQLIQPFELICDDGSGFWLVLPTSHRNSTKIRKFRKWLEQQSESFRG